MVARRQRHITRNHMLALKKFLLMVGQAVFYKQRTLALLLMSTKIALKSSTK